MSKYDRMVEINKKRSDEKIARAIKEIQRFHEEGEKLTIPLLMKRTSLSRGFFYKNPVVREAIDEVMESQGRTADPRRTILDKAMDSRIELLQKQLCDLKNENEQLRDENGKLKKALGRKNLNFIKTL